jgi:hypothetical protein
LSRCIFAFALRIPSQSSQAEFLPYPILCQLCQRSANSIFFSTLLLDYFELFDLFIIDTLRVKDAVKVQQPKGTVKLICDAFLEFFLVIRHGGL